jgi:membrane protease YdiL (CAAX protease family)
MSATLDAVKTIALAAPAALAITAVGQSLWGALGAVNIALSPAVPWAPAVMAIVLPLLLALLSGKIGPKAGAQARRALLPLKPVSGAVWAWSLLAGAVGIPMLALLWGILGELFPSAPNNLPGMGAAPIWTQLAFLATAIVAAPLTEECAFRGYAMGMIRKVMPDAWALVLVSALFALAHVTHGLYATKLSVYFLVGLGLGFTAWRAGSLIPAAVVHSAGDLFFFTLVWPRDAARPHVRLAAAGPDFWLQVAAMGVLAALTLVAYRKLLVATRPQAGGADARGPPMGLAAA